VYVESRKPFERALGVTSAEIVDASMLSPIFGRTHRAGVQPRAEDVAKILFTSGSTGFPKGVPNTHAMLCANQQMIAQLWPFLEEGEPPVLVDWLPWSHTFGGNHNFNMVLFHGGTLLVDEGKPPPQLVGASLKNLMEVPPTLYFNVPAGYASLVPHLEKDDALRKAFFARLEVMFYAAAALPPDLWTRLVALAKKTTDRDVFMTTAWGSTETSPLATSAHFALEAAGNIGLPAPGVTLKLVPNGRKLEVRVKGPSVMSGYLGEPELTKQAFDEEGFYKIGDAVRFVDEKDPSKGLAFDGRVAEDFKLSSGTWVSVTNVRTGVVAQCGGLVSDVVVCGQDKDAIAILAWPTANATIEAVREAIRAWNAKNGASSTRVWRCILLAEPPSIDAGEITDKGYVNQRATIERRAADVARLYAEPCDADVIACD
jgi:feruloyl-CoA synthase